MTPCGRSFTPCLARTSLPARPVGVARGGMIRCGGRVIYPRISRAIVDANVGRTAVVRLTRQRGSVKPDLAELLEVLGAAHLLAHEHTRVGFRQRGFRVGAGFDGADAVADAERGGPVAEVDGRRFDRALEA